MVRPAAWALSAVLLLPAVAARLPHHVLEERQDYAPPVNRSEAVRKAFRLSWKAYYKYAFPNDELYPVSRSFGNSRYTIYFYKLLFSTFGNQRLTDSRQ